MNSIGIAALALQATEQVEDGGLGGDVERGGRLVGNQQARLATSAMAIMARCRWPPESSKV